MKKVGILYHPLNEAAYTLAQDLQEFLSASKIKVWVCSAWESARAKAMVDDTDLVLSVGGDGTILRSAQIVFPFPIPITGVNLGKLGFMTELKAEEVKDRLADLLDGNGWLDERATLEAEFLSGEGPPRIFHALNDVVVARGAVARIINIETSIDDQPMTTYRADGVIVATATGSTGYSLAAGGPLLYPNADDYLLVPIVPHLSPAYPLVLSPSAVVTLRAVTSHEATLSVDGHINLPLASGAVIKVKHDTYKVRFLRIHPRSLYYRTLETKLKGKQ